MIALRVGEEALYFGHGMVVSEENYVSGLGVPCKLLLCGIAMLSVYMNTL